MRKVAAVVAVLAALASAAGAHDGKPRDLHDLWHTWAFDPLVITGLAAMAAIYLTGLYKLWRENNIGRGIGGWHAAAFGASWLSLFVALVSPLHPWGEVLFSAHMTQHEILMLVSAPLLVLGRPLIASLWSLPAAWRKAAGGVFKSNAIERIWNSLTYPLAAWFIHAAALWVWHLPFLFQATLRSDAVHALQHISFFGSAVLFWWAIILGQRGTAAYGAGVLYLFTTSVHSGILGAFLTFVPHVLYPAYADSTAGWGLTPLEDQQLGGLIMWVPAGVVYILAALVMFAGWITESEKRVRRHEAAYYSSSTP